MTEARATRTDVKTATVERTFDAKDSKGRVLGSIVWMGTSEVAEQKNPNGCYYRVEASAIGTTQFFMEPHALRNGEQFGALQRRRYFPTIEARDAAVAAYFLNAEKRATRAR